MTSPAAAVVLAAGLGTRFGSQPKLVALLENKPILQHVLDTLQAARIAPVVVVLGHALDDVRAVFEWREEIQVVNRHPERGILRSVLLGLRRLDETWSIPTRTLIVLGDQPRLSLEQIATLLATPVDEERPFVVPTYEDGPAGNPVLLEAGGRFLVGEYAKRARAADRGLSQFFAGHGDLVRQVEVPGLNPDVDTPEDVVRLAATTIVRRLVRPTPAVRDSYIAGERAMARETGRGEEFLDEAARDFETLVVARSKARIMWAVPTTELWYVDGDTYIGTVMLRHELTPELEQVGGNVGYHVVPGQRRRGHATRMLAEAVRILCAEGWQSVLVTCAPDNVASRRVIEKNGGRNIGEDQSVVRYRIEC